MKRKMTVTVDEELSAHAEALRVDVSHAAQAGLRSVMAAAGADNWKRENADAVDDYNAWVRKEGLPLEAFRRF